MDKCTYTECRHCSAESANGCDLFEGKAWTRCNLRVVRAKVRAQEKVIKVWKTPKKGGR